MMIKAADRGLGHHVFFGRRFRTAAVELRMLRSTSKVGRSLLLSVCGEGRVSDRV
jgi:hypothetical protein